MNLRRRSGAGHERRGSRRRGGRARLRLGGATRDLDVVNIVLDLHARGVVKSRVVPLEGSEFPPCLQIDLKYIKGSIANCRHNDAKATPRHKTEKSQALLPKEKIEKSWHCSL